ncbi:MAG: NUDIX domain-containing protein [Candidatus Gracilibacteria bacterium]|nr:NUDIX domain-containing protein [Candidatus Gracilibacteria bacterium]
MKTYIKARGIIIKDDKIFLLRDKEFGNFLLPGGTQEEGETIEDTFYREMKEETGIDVIIESFLGFKEYVSKKGYVAIQFLFKVKNVDDFSEIIREKCSHCEEWCEIGFYSIDYLKENKFSYPKDLEELFIKAKNNENIVGLIQQKKRI